MKNKKGFTLVELIATIAVLAIVMGLGAYVAIRVINNAREKTYQTTIKNIEANASNYLTENAGRLFFLGVNSSDNINEYQCVTVRNLIDMGFLDKSVLQSKVKKGITVSYDDYVYIERDVKTRAIIKSVYDRDNKYSSLCGNAMVAEGDIRFEFNPDLDKYSREKNVTITYKIKNLNNVQTISDYIKDYSYSGSYTDNGLVGEYVRNLNVSSNGMLEAWINYNEEEIAFKDEEVSTIDCEGPKAIQKYSGPNTVKKTVVIPINIYDEKAGLKKESVSNDDFIVKIGNTEISNFKISKIANNGNCTLEVNNNTLAGKLVIIIKDDSIEDILGNLNDEIILEPDVIFDNTYKVSYEIGTCPSTAGGRTESNTATYGADFLTTPNGFTCTGYTFNGWVDKADSSILWNLTSNGVYENGNGAHPWKWTYTEDKILVARWTPNVLTIKYYVNGAQKNGDNDLSQELLARRTYNYDGTNFATYGLPDYNSTSGSWNLIKRGYQATGNWLVGSSSSTTKISESKKFSTIQAAASDLGVLTNFETGNVEVSVYAEWTPKIFRIRYHGNGHTSSNGYNDPWTDTRTFTFGQSYGADKAIIYTNDNWYSRTGYEFTGWNTKADGKGVSSWTPGYPNGTSKKWSWDNGEYDIGLEDDNYLDLYAKWTANKYKVTLDHQGGTGAEYDAYWYYYKVGSTGKYYYADEACTNSFSSDKIQTLPTKTGYTFGGYYTGTNGSGTQYVNASGAFVNNLYANNASNITLYAKWIPITYTIKYVCGTGTTGTAPKSQTVSYGGSVTIASGAGGCSKDGYTFSNWTSPGENGTGTSNWKGWSTTSWSYVNGYGIQNNTLTLTASWTQSTYRLTADAGGGIIPSTTGWTVASDGHTAVKNVAAGQKYGLLPTPSVSGYTFLGWYTKATYATEDDKVTADTIMPSGNMTIYAVWASQKVGLCEPCGSNSDCAVGTCSGTCTSTWGTSYTCCVTGGGNQCN